MWWVWSGWMDSWGWTSEWGGEAEAWEDAAEGVKHEVQMSQSAQSVQL